MDHVVIFAPEHLRSRNGRPDLSEAVETRDRPGPAFKLGVGPDETVWIRMGPLLVAKAKVRLAWSGEYAGLDEVRRRTSGALHDLDDFWAGRPKVGYAVVAALKDVYFLKEPSLAGPRTYGYEWIVIESDKKADTWLTRRPPEDKDAPLVERFRELTEG